MDTPAPSTLPRIVRDRVLDWSDERGFGNPIMVTLAYGFAFDDNDADNLACHVSGFETRSKAAAAIKAVQPCACSRCRSGHGG